MRRSGWLVLVLLAAPFVSSEAAVSPALPRGHCDLRIVQPGIWCPKCSKEVDRKELKKKKCPTCNGAVTVIRFCVKKIYFCLKGPRSTRCRCCPKARTKLDKARVILRCTGCGKEGTGPKCAQPVCRAANRKTRVFCARSGSPPHATP